ncbi:glycoside hydrolase family 125 protein [Paenibacillus kyungheensis]|uniref:Glycoside hydrolase family 125 protein n=2 Tax=Paenibacillus kyungheensis TaxID=1452732 RepID=A0AAX3M847_9BACL|nr:glycoside hydrolase family 125 protein [Paenibacillus kyungheensis]WCT58080.1 glycoside hydrolase family 125 protein [Paenibacillus kyungheensis]
MFRQCYANTYETTLQRLADGSTFVITGDIPAMWLRDSTAQVRHYLPVAVHDTEVADMIAGVIRRQIFYIGIDPYGNAFNIEDNDHRYDIDLTELNGWVWERKYEIDSLCYPIQLSYLFWKATGRTDLFDESFRTVLHRIIDLWRCEQHHDDHSPYVFMRENCPPSDTLRNQGKGMPTSYTGMTWSGFRPSDDACTFGYLIPSNMFASVVLGYMAEIAIDMYHDERLATKALRLQEEIDFGIENYGTVIHPQYGKIYAYETDGQGNHNLMDDANVPSLLSIPYLGYRAVEDKVYQNTRAFVLSEHNPYYFTGIAASGIGSPHTPTDYIWHIALSMQGLTSTDPLEIKSILDTLASTHADTGFMHEGFHKDDPTKFTRPWFAWANSLFAELVSQYALQSSKEPSSL